MCITTGVGRHQTIHLQMQPDTQAELGPGPGEEGKIGFMPPPMELLEVQAHQMALHHAGVVLAGFRDCCEEALRYLVDVEKLAETDPLVVGLRRHLLERQQQLDVQQILNEHLAAAEMHAYPMDPEDSLGPVEGAIDDSGNASLLEPLSPEAQVINSDEEMNSDILQDSCTQENPDHNGLSHQNEVNLEQSVLPHLNNNAITQEEFTEPLRTLAVLAQNDSAIASLTEEIIALLDSEEEETDMLTDIEAE